MFIVASIAIVKASFLDRSPSQCTASVQSAPPAYYGFAYNLTFTTKLPNCKCIHHDSKINNDGPFSYCLIHNYNFSIPKKKLFCNFQGCTDVGQDITYNVGLAIKNMTIDNIGIYTFIIALTGCSCNAVRTSSINLTAQGRL